MIRISLVGCKTLDIKKLNLKARCSTCKEMIPARSHHIVAELLKSRYRYSRIHFSCFDRFVRDILNVQKELEKLKTELFAKVL